MKLSTFKTITAVLGSLLITVGFYIATNNLGATLVVAGLMTFLLHLSGSEEED